ncbi:MAG: beta-N-acetylglucosaminidase [Thermotogaceae bacterium]|nr:beta-N-acetylglucosaminidase [Thermotogaceae bacterium]
MYFEIRGVVEGFYGTPWAMEKRREIMKFLGEHKYNLYIYAPKDDQLHRKRWRNMYDEDFKSEFSKLVVEGSSWGVTVAFSVSPGLAVKYSSDSDVDIMISKFIEMANVGVRSFALFYDDIPETLVHEEDIKEFTSLAQAQSFFANTVYRSLKRKVENISSFIVCPTHYHGKEITEYMRTLGKELDRDISIMWTGPGICSERISAENARLAEMAFERKPLLWDNYPVNDAFMVPELHVGPYEGRDPEIVEHSEGIVLNPMIQPCASKIALCSAAEFLSDPYGFEVEESWSRAVKEIAPSCEEEMKIFCEYYLMSPIHRGHSKRLVDTRDSLALLISQNRWSQVQELLMQEAKRISESAEVLKETLPTSLMEEIEPWILEFSLWGKVLRAAAEIVSARLLMFAQTVTEEEISESHDLCIEAESALCELVKADTLSGGTLFRESIHEILVRVKGFTKLLLN